ncbi:beta-1,4-galactosyltransferase 6-like [Amphiura filiformis]|uniref:beta-1,4-galactosyltransferase 6-like n=1 Tax=Amphiura filiformis TaxID=82378 RepID=UPI003B21B07C
MKANNLPAIVIFIYIQKAFDTIHRVGAAKSLDLSPVLMQTVEQELFGKSLVNVTTLINKTNNFLTKINRTNSEQYTVSCIQLKEIKKCQKMFPTSITTQCIPVSSYTYMPGGHWKPTDCAPRWKVAIIIPYRDRAIHLPILLRYLTPFLQRQLLEFHFFVVEQMNDLLFNKAMLMNIAILESLNFTKWDCFVFHDVEHIPLNDHNYYGCSGMPRHFMSGSDQFNNKLPYASIFGGVTGFTPEQLFNINGFPNVYWGWGAEDDEIYDRARKVGKYNITRTSHPIGLYNTIKHHHQSAPKIKHDIKYKLLWNFLPRVPFDGFSNLMYDEPVITTRPLYTHIAADIRKLTIPGYKDSVIKLINVNQIPPAM